jgi:glutathione S-transferase
MLGGAGHIFSPSAKSSGRAEATMMKLYGAVRAANPRRVKIYIAEKGLEGVIEQIDFAPPAAEKLKTPEFLAKNPAGKIPLLELDDGTYISESAAIIEYLEELYPNPPMIGTTPEERAKVRSVERVVADQSVLCRLYYLHMGPSFLQSSRGFAWVPEVLVAIKPDYDNNLHTLDVRMGENPFLAGAKPTVADCHLYAMMSAGVEKFNYVIPDDFPGIQRWYENFSKRPSASAGNIGGPGYVHAKDDPALAPALQG